MKKVWTAELTKIEKSIKLIKEAESLALKYQEYGFHLAFSGGKDSQVIYELCKMAGVKFKPVMQVTTIDPPELMRFIRSHYPDVIFERPKMNFYELIIKYQSLPTMNRRFCCKELKEQSGGNTVTILGIRKQESSKRAKRNELEISGHKYSNSLDQFNIDKQNHVLCVNGKDKILLNPIINWTHSDVWRFIRGRGLNYCELYDRGYHRIGCMFCPYSSKKAKQLDRINYPKVEKQIKKSIATLCEMGKFARFNNNVDDVFDWWISKLSSAQFFATKKQLKIHFNHDNT